MAKLCFTLMAPSNGYQTSASEPLVSFDVLDYIMSFLCKSDLLRMMQTCRYLCYAGTKSLIRLCTLPDTLITNTKIRAFCRWMFAGGSSRFALLDSIAVYVNTMDDETATLLAQTLASANVLTTLGLDISYNTYTSHPELARSLATIVNLKHLNLTAKGGQRLVEALADMSLPLISLDLRFVSQDVRNPAKLLEKFAGTLQTLMISGACFDPSDAGAQFPHLIHLQLKSIAQGATLYTPYMVRSFPHLLRLGLPWVYAYGIPNFEDVRERNVHALCTRSWARIDRVEGDSSWIYMTGLKCRIDHLYTSSKFDGEHLSAILRDTQPTRLTLMVSIPVSLPVSSTSLFDSSISCVTNLDLAITFYGSTTDSPNDILLSALASASRL